MTDMGFARASFMLRDTHDAMFDGWSEPALAPDGLWRSNPPGYSIGFIASHEKAGAERMRRLMRDAILARPRAIWC